jgi:hypothetical protein
MVISNTEKKKIYGKTGNCFEAAGRYMMDHGAGTNLVLVHGEVTGQGPIEGVKFGHAWIEDGNNIIDVSNGRDIRQPKDLYYRIGRIGNNLKKYNYKQFIDKIVKTKVWGPWDLVTSSGL